MTMADGPDSADYLGLLELLRNMAAVATGIRTDLISEGWSAEGAEQVAIMLLQRAAQS